MSIFWINLVPDISYITFPSGNFFQFRNETKELLQKPRNYSRNQGTILETKELFQKPRNYSRNQRTTLETKELLQKQRNYSRNKGTTLETKELLQKHISNVRKLYIMGAMLTYQVHPQPVKGKDRRSKKVIFLNWCCVSKYPRNHLEFTLSLLLLFTLPALKELF